MPTPALPTLFCAFPGTTLLETALEKGFKSPDSLEGWGSTIDVIVKNSGNLPAYVDKRVERAINYIRIIRQKNFNNTLLSIPAKIVITLIGIALIIALLLDYFGVL